MMFYPYTERQAQLIALAGELADRFAARAAEQDRSGTFPFENFADIRAAGLPALAVPEMYGGWGASLLDAVMTMERLAQGDGSTALSLTMHMQTIGSAAENMNGSGAWPPALLAQIATESVTRGALINACATEPEMGSPSRGGKPKTTARPAGDGATWIIDGRKSFASMAPALDYFIIPATLLDGSDDVARFVAPRCAQIQIVETWDAMGMRTTGSHDIVLDGVRVPEGNIVARASQSTGGGANAWFLLTVSAVYVGVAIAAQQAAACYAQQRVPTALGRAIATLEHVQRHLGQAELLLTQARLLLYHAAELWMHHPDQRSQLTPTIVAAKVTATNNAIAAVDHAMRVAGGASMTRALPLERYYRDVRGGLSHPVTDDEAYLQFGRQVLDSGDR